MKYDDFKVETFNGEEDVRVKHIASGIVRMGNDVTKEGITKLMYDIKDEIAVRKRPCSFAVALEAVISEGKGMHIDGDKSVVRAQFPDEYSVSTLPYLYISTELGQYPWAIESCAPFATWVVID